MKGSRVYVICMSVAVALLFLLQLRLPRDFTWRATFSKEDSNPFGMYVFDSVFKSAMPDYAVTDETFVQLGSGNGPVGVLAVNSEFKFGRKDIGAIKKILHRGGKVMVVGLTCSYGDSLFLDSLGIGADGYGYFNLSEMRRQFMYGTDTVYWAGGGDSCGEGSYRYYSMLNSGKVCIGDSANADVDFLAYTMVKVRSYERTGTLSLDSVVPCSDGVAADSARSGHVAEERDMMVPKVIAARRKVGQGELIVVSAPLLFTNFGVLDRDTYGLVFRLMSQFKGVPVVRTQGYMDNHLQTGGSHSPFSYFLSQKPLREALYLGLLVIMVFMVFTARRRQRAIPVVEAPVNHTLEFAQLIGTLYYQRKDHADLVRKKFVFFAEELRAELSVDVGNAQDDEHTFAVMAERAVMPKDEVAAGVRLLRLCCNSELLISKEEMRRHIDWMNRILNRI